MQDMEMQLQRTMMEHPGGENEENIRLREEIRRLKLEVCGDTFAYVPACLWLCVRLCLCAYVRARLWMMAVGIGVGDGVLVWFECGRVCTLVWGRSSPLSPTLTSKHVGVHCVAHSLFSRCQHHPFVVVNQQHAAHRASQRSQGTHGRGAHESRITSTRCGRRGRSQASSLGSFGSHTSPHVGR